MLRIALIYDDRTRPETTGSYCRRALDGLCQLDFFHPDEVERIPASAFDVYLRIDDGLRYKLPDGLRPAAYWAIDTHMDFDWSLEVSKSSDFVFAAQRPGARRLLESGIQSARWLPLACDPEIHRQHGVPKEYDVSFVGTLCQGPRRDLAHLIQRHFRKTFIGEAYFDVMARIYSASHAVFNRSVLDDINMRVFEALSCGSLLVTNSLPDSGQSELFRDGIHLATYEGEHDLLDKLRFYLARHELRARIARAGREEVVARHTYKHRMRELVDVVEQGLQARVHAAVPGDLVPNGQPPSGPSPEVSHPGQQDPGYYDFPRPELLALVPAAAKHVLDVGCGTGRLGAAIKARQDCRLVGIEVNEPAAALAREKLDQVVVGDIEQIEPDLGAATFDCIILGDVLEHLCDPSRLLERVSGWLAPGGCLVASIPNVRHHTVVRSLLDGNWMYEPAGLLDRTHVHFFTRRTIERLLSDAGYSITGLAGLPAPGEGPLPDRFGDCVRLGQLALTGLSDDEAREFYVYQWLLTAVPRPISVAAPSLAEAACDANDSASMVEAADGAVSTGPKVMRNGPVGPPEEHRSTLSSSPTLHAPGSTASNGVPRCLLLMVVYNRLQYTRLALEAVLALDYPQELLDVVIWNNGSTDGTAEYLEQRLRGLDHVRLIASGENRGVVFPMNDVWWSDQGHRAELLAKIDNDTLVPPELLKRLAECHLQSRRLGVLSGFHFRLEGEALADEGRTQTIDGVRVLSQPYVGGCAVMVRRQVLDELGQIASLPETVPGRRAFMDCGWTAYQEQVRERGYVNGYPWPLIHVDHMEDTRSQHCIRSAEHQEYKRELRGMNLEQFTEQLCVWRPHWPDEADRAAAREWPRPARVHPDDTQPCLARVASLAARRMRFNQNFRHDFHEFDFRGPPFAFVRFGDGERSICMGQPVQCQDGWCYPGGRSQLADDLLGALSYSDPDYYIGISDGCCDQPARDWYLERTQVPLSQITFANIFVNGNYRRFQEIDLSGMAIVASSGGDFMVPADILASGFDVDGLVERLLDVDRPILVSAGPISCVIIHKYWQRAARRQVIVDVGSAIDERTKGRRTRMYQQRGSRTAELACTW